MENLLGSGICYLNLVLSGDLIHKSLERKDLYEILDYDLKRAESIKIIGCGF